MNTAKDLLLKLMDEMTEDQIAEVVDFAEYLKLKTEKNKDIWNLSSQETIKKNMDAYRELAK